MNIKQPITSKLKEFQEKDSNWKLDSIFHLEININKYNPLRPGSNIALPQQIKNTQACINVHNSDNMCFKFSI